MSAATLPSGRHPTVPETNTRFPLRTPKEYGPIGCATEAVFTICLLINSPPPALLDHLIRPQQQQRRDGEAERLGGLGIHEHPRLGLLYGDVARPHTPEK